MERWKGRVALVTGASEGIGEAIARHLAVVGMRVMGVARSHHKIQAWAADLPESCEGEVHGLHCDVTKEEDILAAVAWARENLGGIDVLINNAGVAPPTNLYDASTTNMRQQFEVNVLGLCVFTREVIADMRSRGIDDGHIFHINSDSGQFDLNTPGFHFYAGTKHAVRVMTEGLRKELRDLGTKIRITSISPGLVKTNVLLNSGYDKETNDKIFAECPHIEPEHIAYGVEFALASPPHVQVHELMIRGTGETY